MELIKVQTPVTNVSADEKVSAVVVSGCLNNTFTVNTASSYQLYPSAPISALWSITPPSNQTIVNRRMLVRAYIQFDFVGGTPSIGSNDAPSFMPLSQLIDICSVQINSEQVTETVSDKIGAMMCFGNNAEERSKSLSLTAAMPDYYDYNGWATYGTGKSPLAFYGENSSEPTRGGFPYVQVSPNRIQIAVCEPLFLSPFDTGIGKTKEGLVNINQLNVNLRFKPNASRCWSHSSLGNAITDVQVSFYRPPELLINYQTPQLLDRLPMVQSLYFTSSQSYVKSVETLAPSAETQVISDSIRLSAIPKAIYLFCRHSDATSNFTTPSTFLHISNLSLNWCNQSGLFAQASAQDLFEMSVENGLNYDWTAWYKHKGSVLCLKPGKDIGLLDSEAPGLSGSFTIQTQLTVKNVSSASFTPQFYMVVVQEGIISIGPSSCRTSLSNLTPEMVLSAKEQKDSGVVDYHDMVELQGGSFWSGLKNVLGKLARGVSTVSKPLSTVSGEYAPVVSGVGSVANALASALGAGGNMNMAGSGYVGGARLMGGARLVGGRRR